MGDLTIKQKILFILFFPLGQLWDFVYRLRRLLYKIDYIGSEQFNIPVISIGNITFGGTGKTPVVIYLANYFHRKGKKAMILTRGYKSRMEQSSAILTHGRSLRYSASIYGDEPVLIAEKLQSGSVVVGKRRSTNFGQYFLTDNPDVVLLDDGHQHLKIKRDLNIVLFDALTPLSEYNFVPVGGLREGWSGLDDASIIMINRVDLVGKSKVEALIHKLRKNMVNDIPIMQCIYQAQGWFCRDKKYPLDYLANKKVICVAGIASPESFKRLVEKSGAIVVKSMFYSDHFRYQKNHFTQICVEAKKEDAIITCTEKDIVKLRPYINLEDIYVLDTGIKIVQGEELFTQTIDQACQKRWA